MRTYSGPGREALRRGDARSGARGYLADVGGQLLIGGEEHVEAGVRIAAFIHDLPAEAISNVAGDSDYVRVQVLTPAGVLDRDKQLGVVEELTELVARAAGDPKLREHTWVLITESPEGGWGIGGHANTGADIADAARRELAG